MFLRQFSLLTIVTFRRAKMKTRSGQVKYGFLGLRSGRALSAVCRRRASYGDRPVVVSIVQGVRLDKHYVPITCAGRPCAWILTRESTHTRVYGPLKKGETDWRDVPWEESRDDVDVGWIVRLREGVAVIHFDRLDITVAQAAQALTRSLQFNGDKVVFDHRTATMDTKRDGKTIVWERKSTLREAIPPSERPRIFVHCSFC